MQNADIAALELPRRPIAVLSLLLLLGAGMAGASGGVWHDAAVSTVLFVLGIVVSRHVVLLVLAVRARPPLPVPQDQPSVSIVMPACNEEAVIESALDSLCRIDYPDVEIIVVDDGSTDRTLDRVRNFLDQRPGLRLRIFSQSNSGKASALNVGVHHAQGELVLCVDADSRVRPDAITRAVPHFSDRRVGAVGGAVEIANTNTLLARFQQLEYSIGLNFARRALSSLDAVTVVPGPIGLFRREALLSVGGYDERRDLFAEDADLTVRLLGAGWKVRGDVSMIADTEAPQQIFALLRQRYRWKRGLYQTFSRNFMPLLIANGKRGIYIAIYLGLECFVLDVLNAAIAVFFFSYVLFHGEIRPLLWVYLLVVGIDLSALLFTREMFPEILRSAGRLLVQRFTYAQVLQVWNVLALFDEWRSTRMDWDKLQRLGPRHVAHR